MKPFPFLNPVAALVASFLASAASAETVVISGSREPLAPDRLAADVVLIESAALQGSRADSLADVLRREAGVQLSRTGGPGQSSGVFIRGAASQQTLVLVDGMRVGSATLGSAALEAFGLAGIERVEVLRGPGSSLFGADAVGGVVNIVTEDGRHSGADARVALGGFGAREASAGWRGGIGPASLPLTLSVRLSREQDDGVSAITPGDRFGSFNPDRDGHRRDSAQFKLGATPAAGQRVGLSLLSTRLNSQYDAADFLPPTFTADPSADFRTRLSTRVLALDWRGTLGEGFTGSARMGRSIDDSTSGGRDTDRFRTERQHSQAQLAWRHSGALQVVAAIEQQDDEARSSSYARDVERSSRALVLEATGRIGSLSWQADLRRDDASDFGRADSGRLGATWAWTPGWRLRALAGTSWRAPSFNDLYFPGFGVASLRPERGRSAEVGLHWQGEAAAFSATTWQNRVRDLVAFEPDAARCPADPSYSFGCAANLARARLSGTSLSGQVKAGAWQGRVQLDALKARDGLSGTKLPRRADAQATLAADWRQGDWSAGASLVHLGSRPDGGITLAAETTLDLSAAWRFAPGWQLQARVDNSTDEQRVPARDYQGLGRQAWLVLRWESGR